MADRSGKLAAMAFADVYPHYVAKVERKGRTVAELHAVIGWLTGYDDARIAEHVERRTSFADFFAEAHLTEHTALITGVVCGVRVEEIEDPLVQRIRWLDKLVDELARGKAMEKVLRA